MFLFRKSWRDHNNNRIYDERNIEPFVIEDMFRNRYPFIYYHKSCGCEAFRSDGALIFNIKRKKYERIRDNNIDCYFPGEVDYTKLKSDISLSSSIVIYSNGKQPTYKSFLCFTCGAFLFQHHIEDECFVKLDPFVLDSIDLESSCYRELNSKYLELLDRVEEFSDMLKEFKSAGLDIDGNISFKDRFLKEFDYDPDTRLLMEFDICEK